MPTGYGREQSRGKAPSQHTPPHTAKITKVPTSERATFVWQAAARAGRLNPRQVLQLQRVIGNRTTSDLIARTTGATAGDRALLGADRVPVQRSKPKSETTIPFMVSFDRPLTGEEFMRVASAQLKIDPRKVKWSNVRDHYEPSNSPVTVYVSASIITSLRSSSTAADIGLDVDESGRIVGAAGRADELSAMPDGGEKQRLYDEIDRRYWQVTGIPEGHKIVSRKGEPGKVAMWEQIRDEVLAQRAFVADLPEKAQQVLRRSTDGLVVGPEHYTQIVRIANKIESMQVDDLENYLSRATTTTDLTALEQTVDNFLATRNAAPEKIKTLLEKTDNGDWDVDSETAALDAPTMFYLPLAERIKVIKHIADGYIVGDTDEQTIIRLLTSTPSSDLPALMTELKFSESALLKKLESVIDGEENKQYYAALRNILFRSLEPEQAQKMMDNARILPWADPGIIKAVYNVRFKYETVEYTKEGKIRIVYWTNFAIGGMKNQEQIFEPDEIIGLHFFMDEDFADAKKGETIFMPAANMLAFKHEQFSRELSLAVDVGLLFAGGAGLLAKGSRLAKAIAVLDTTLSVADITVNSFRSDIANTPEGKSFLRAWDTVNTLIAVYGLSRIIMRLPETFRNLRRAYQEFRAKSGHINADDLAKIDKNANEVLNQADEVARESDISSLRDRFSKEELQAFEKQLEKASNITDAGKRRAALADIESQVTTQKENIALVAELKKNNPKMSNKQIADLAAPKIKVPTVPHGMDADEFERAQDFIRKFLQDRGITDAEGFATGSRITGTTFNPGKATTFNPDKTAFGQPIVDFSKRDFDITIITPNRALTNSLSRNLEKSYAEVFGYKLGVRPVTDLRKLEHLPVYGKIDLKLR